MTDPRCAERTAREIVRVGFVDGGGNELVRLGVFNGRVPAQGFDELGFLASRHLDEVRASAADSSAVAETVLAQQVRRCTAVSELDDDLTRDLLRLRCRIARDSYGECAKTYGYCGEAGCNDFFHTEHLASIRPGHLVSAGRLPRVLSRYRGLNRAKRTTAGQKLGGFACV
jgi:hypothetical protein